MSNLVCDSCGEIEGAPFGVGDGCVCGGIFKDADEGEASEDLDDGADDGDLDIDDVE